MGTLPEFTPSESYPYPMDDTLIIPEVETSTSKGPALRTPSPMDTDTTALPFAGVSSINPMLTGKCLVKTLHAKPANVPIL